MAQMTVLEAVNSALHQEMSDDDNVVVLGEVVILLGALTFAGANGFPLVLLGRVMTGLGVGICGLAKPLIVSELAPPHMRGTLVSLVAVGQSIGRHHSHKF